MTADEGAEAGLAAAGPESERLHPARVKREAQASTRALRRAEFGVIMLLMPRADPALLKLRVPEM